ncbi:hypothetical protein ACGFIV_27895 [Sphaerisporangium sp. NPDC049003]|uniref:hypothetical protein n=1 Tax=Sphaerisporangium sp. NPDC049003 TaxID=3364517 RepID=UPI0037144917
MPSRTYTRGRCPRCSAPHPAEPITPPGHVPLLHRPRDHPAPLPRQTGGEAFAHALTQQSFYETITTGRGPTTWETTVTARMPYANLT